MCKVKFTNFNNVKLIKILKLTNLKINNIKTS